MNEALVLLVLVWAALLLPGALRSRNTSPHATVGGFERAMDVLRSEVRRPATGRQVMVPGDAGRIVERPNTGEPARRPRRPRASDPVVVRRLAWFLRCLAATGITLVVGVIAGGWLWLPFVVSAGLTAAYVAVLRHLKLQRDEADRVVRELDLDEEHPAERQAVAVGEADWVGSGTVRLRRWDD